MPRDPSGSGSVVLVCNGPLAPAGIRRTADHFVQSLRSELRITADSASLLSAPSDSAACRRLASATRLGSPRVTSEESVAYFRAAPYFLIVRTRDLKQRRASRGIKCREWEQCRDKVTEVIFLDPNYEIVDWLVEGWTLVGS